MCIRYSKLTTASGPAPSRSCSTPSPRPIQPDFHSTPSQDTQARLSLILPPALLHHFPDGPPCSSPFTPAPAPYTHLPLPTHRAHSFSVDDVCIQYHTSTQETQHN